MLLLDQVSQAAKLVLQIIGHAFLEHLLLTELGLIQLPELDNLLFFHKFLLLHLMVSLKSSLQHLL